VSPQSDNVAKNELPSRVIAGGAWTVGGRAVSALSALGVNVLASRLAAPEHVGAYFLAASVATAASLVAQFGLQVVVVRRVAESLAVGNGGDARSVVTAILKIGMAFALLIAFAVGALSVAGVSFVASPLVAGSLYLVLAWIVVQTPASLLAESFRGFHEYRFAALFNNTMPGVLLVVALLILAASGRTLTLHSLLVCSVGAAAVSVAAAGALMARRMRAMGPGVRCAMSDLIVEGMPLMLSTAAMIVVTQMDLWIVGAYRPPEEVATYGAAGRLLQLVMMPMLIVNAVIAPVIAGLHGRRDYTGMQSTAGTAAAVGGIVAVVILGVFVAFSGDALAAIFGEYYRRAATVLIILGIGQTVNALCGPGAVILMMSGHARATLVISLACGAILTLGGLGLVDRYGITGVACGAACATAGHGILSLLWTRRRLGVRASISGAGIAGATAVARSILRRLHN
jgi:O-antigen/teichoic acid export membrane protein